MRRLGKDAMHRITEHAFEPEGHAARPTPDAAGQIHEQRMLRIDTHAGALQLPGQALGRDRVAEEELGRVLVIDEMAGRVGRGLAPALLHRHAVVRGVFDHRDAARAQAVLLPLPRVGRHVHRGLEAQLGAHDADRQAEIAGGADRDTVAPEERARRIAGERGVVVTFADQPGLQRQPLGVPQHLVDAAAGLDRAGDRQRVVGLEPQRAGCGQVRLACLPRLFEQATLQLRQRHDARLDDPAGGRGLGKHLGDVGREALQARAGVGDVVCAQADIGERRRCRRDAGVEPARLAQGDQVADEGMAGAPGLEGFAVDHERSGGVIAVTVSAPRARREGRIACWLRAPRRLPRRAARAPRRARRSSPARTGCRP